MMCRARVTTTRHHSTTTKLRCATKNLRVIHCGASLRGDATRRSCAPTRRARRARASMDGDDPVEPTRRPHVFLAPWYWRRRRRDGAGGGRGCIEPPAGDAVLRLLDRRLTRRLCDGRPVRTAHLVRAPHMTVQIPIKTDPAREA